MTSFVKVHHLSGQKHLACLKNEGKGPPLIWLGGFRSTMRALKAQALSDFAVAEKRFFLRFDYSGHGESDGIFEECTLSDWLEDALAMIRHNAEEPPLLIGSSMGGWLALLAEKALRHSALAPKGLVLIAPAVDFTQELMWDRFSPQIQDIIQREGVFHLPSAYDPVPTPITKRLIDDGRRHSLFGKPITPGCPVHILQGRQDPDVPYTHALKLVEHLEGCETRLTMISDGDHRLSRDEDIAVLIGAVQSMA